ncbi:MAG: methionyl-tRNA formyltransferase [Bacteroidota bacterium]
MIKLLVTGSSSPLLKTLEYLVPDERVKLMHVFLDKNQDAEAMDFCDSNKIPFDDAALLKSGSGLQMLREKPFHWLLSVNSTVILNSDVLSLPEKGALNLHPGKLPEYAGLHTHQWAIRNGETTFGVTLHHMEPGIDTGDIAFQQIFPVKPRDTGLSLYLKCLREGIKLVRKALDYMVEDRPLPAISQDLSKRKLYTHKMALNGRIDWHQPAETIFNFIRAADYAPFQSPTYIPYTAFAGKRICITKAEVVDDMLKPGEIRFTRDADIIAGASSGSLKLKKMLDENQKLISAEQFRRIVNPKNPFFE